MFKKSKCNLPNFRSEIGLRQISKNDLSENETRDNVSMNNFKNSLTAFERQVEGGEIHNGKEGC